MGVSKDGATTRLQAQIDAISAIRRDDTFVKWRRDTELLIEHVFGPDTRHLRDFKSVGFRPSSYNMSDPEPVFARAFERGRQNARAVLQSMVDEVRTYWSDQPTSVLSQGAIARLEQICQRFHLVARQLRDRHESRSTLEIEDEYDVQDLLHALLRLDFEDVRPEEWTPSYAGGSARMDFLLKQEKAVVEVKKTRKGLASRQIGDELIVDIARYKNHPECERLVCFVYDPDGRIGNPAELETDLSGEQDNLEVLVVVAPRGT